MAGLRRILAGANLAFNLDMRTFGERCSEFGELAPNDAAVPGCTALAFTSFAVFPAPLGGQGQHRKLGLALGGANLGVLAEESDEGDSILIHDLVLLFCSRSLSGHSEASGARSQGSRSAFLGGPDEILVSESERIYRA